MINVGKALIALVVSMWAGALAAVGFLVAPKLFALLPERTLAGSIAGSLFVDLAWVNFAFCLVLTGCFLFLRPGLFHWVLLAAIALCTALNHFWIRAVIADLRTSATMDTSFAFWHGLSSILYVLTFIFVAVLSLKLILHE